MELPGKRGRVRWTLSLIAAILSIELVLFGLVGLFASIPAPEYVVLSYSDPNPAASVFPAQIVHFASAPTDGDRSISIEVLNSSCPVIGPRTWCPTVTLTSCLDVSCQQLGPFSQSVVGTHVPPQTVNAWGPVSVTVPAQYSTFQVGLAPAYQSPPLGNATVLLAMQWVSPGGLPTGFTPAMIVSLGIATAGAVPFPAAWLHARRRVPSPTPHDFL